jgi:ubiquitin-activating enzyme E1
MMASTEGSAVNVDVNLYSRQIYAVGMTAMRGMLSATYVFYGCDPVAAETAKNIILSGARKLLFYDADPCGMHDVEANCFVTAEDVTQGKNRADVLAAKLSALSNTTTLRAFPQLPTLEEIVEAKPTCVIFSNTRRTPDLTKLLQDLHRQHVRFSFAAVSGVFFKLFNDFGESFTVRDPSGEEEVKYFVLECTRFGFSAGDAAVPPHQYALKVGTTEQELIVTKGSHVKLQIPVPSSSSSNATSTIVTTAPLPVTHQLNSSSFVVDASTLESNLLQVLETQSGEGVYVETVTLPVHMSFVDFDAAHSGGPTTAPIVMNFSHDDSEVFLLHETLAAFEVAHARRPLPYDKSDALTFLQLADPLAQKWFGRALSLDEQKALVLLSFTASTTLPAMVAFAGGIVAQEAMKTASLKYVPCKQIWFSDLRELIPIQWDDVKRQDSASFDSLIESAIVPADLPKPSEPTTRYSLQASFWGKKALADLQNSNVFVIGAGALGCEYVKNLALAGIGCGPRGKLTLTDNDRIEKSNLSRQFLFRNEDVGKFKAEVAAAAAKKMNSAIKLRVLTEKVHAESCDPIDGVFDDRFWSQLSAIATAVDNIAARLFLDDMSVAYRKPMVDSGTLGPLGHVEVFLPKVTDRMKSSSFQDQGKKIPFCTLHFFPTTIQHCIQFGTDLFAAWFSNPASEANRFLRTPFSDYVKSIDEGAKRVVFSDLLATLESQPTTLADCAIWMRQQFEGAFVNPLLDLVHSKPKDLVEDGKPYWGGARKYPLIPSFNPMEDENHRNFILFGTLLLAEMYKVKIPASGEGSATSSVENIDQSSQFVEDPKIQKIILDAALTALLPVYKPSIVKVDEKDKEKDQTTDAPPSATAEAPPETYHAQVKELETKLERVAAQTSSSAVAQPPAGGNAGDVVEPLRSLVFEKDLDSNGHISFITAVSNIRASCYRIPQEDFSFTKKVAGRIIPAMITTTAAVTGLASLQLYHALRSAKGKPEGQAALTGTQARNFNLSVSDVGMTMMFEPKEATLSHYVTPKPSSTSDGTSAALIGKKFSCWDTFHMAVDVDITLEALLATFEERFSPLQVDQIVESSFSVWIYNRNDSSEDERKRLGFPFGAQTAMQLPKDKVSISSRQERRRFFYSLRCSSKDPSLLVAENLPLLCYEFKE